MTEQEQIKQLKEANETWRKRWASERYEVEQLKAQVNCLRDALLNTIMYRVGTVNYGDPLEALEATPEHCLAEVKAKAIKDYKNQLAESKQLDLATKIMTVTI